jgi:hypothetical protein
MFKLSSHRDPPCIGTIENGLKIICQKFPAKRNEKNFLLSERSEFKKFSEASG